MGNFVNFDYIMPKDRSGIEMWMHFQDETGLEIEKKESISEDTRLQEISNSEKSEKNSYDFADYQISINPNFQRTIAEERVEMVNKKFPVIANRMDNQEKLNFYNEMASGLGDNWLEKFEDRILEVHISENDEKNDLHLGLKINSWQLEALRIFKKKKKNLIYTLESRNCSIREIKNNIKMIKSAIY